MWCAHLKNRITYLFERKYRPEKLLLILNSYAHGIISVFKVQAFEIIFCFIWPHFSRHKPIPNKQFSSRAQCTWCPDSNLGLPTQPGDGGHCLSRKYMVILKLRPTLRPQLSHQRTAQVSVTAPAGKAWASFDSELLKLSHGFL